jgi:hypothetical protein
MTAVSNGVESRPVKFKIKTDVAPILNLVINMTRGKVDKLEWKNSCYKEQGCSYKDGCKNSSVTFNAVTYTEEVRTLDLLIYFL